MSTRERWIVYPLLFLALGTAIKPKLTPPETRGPARPVTVLRVDRVECGALSVLGDDDKPRVVARAVEGGGQIHVADNQGRVVVAIRADAETRAGTVETRNENGSAQAAMMSSGTGGELVVYDNMLSRSVGIIHRGGRSGLIETDLRTGKEKFEPAGTTD
jgi:hypothetical protein